MIPVGVVNLLIFTIQQIVAKKYVELKNDELLIKMFVLVIIHYTINVSN